MPIRKYGLKKKDKEAFGRIRSDYNRTFRGQKNGCRYLYVVLLYGFQQQLRFNSSYEFNNPVGESGFSESVREKIISFSRRIKEMDVTFRTGDYEEVLDSIDKETLVYIDPPYLITLGSYNDGKRGFKGWNRQEELRLLDFMTRILRKGCKIVLSNLFEYKGKTNEELKGWVATGDVTVLTKAYRGRNEALIISQ